MGARFDAVLFDAGGVLVLPDPVAIGAAVEPFVDAPPIGRFHRAHHAGLFALESEVLHDPVTVEHLDWTIYRRAYLSSLGVMEAALDDAVEAMSRVWSALIWRFRIEDSVAALWRLAAAGVPAGVVSNASGQIEAVLRNEGVCQVGHGAGVPVACVVDSHVVGVAKPDPRIFDGALAALGDIDPARVAYIGDSAINDIAGANAAGLVPLHLDPFDDYAEFEHERIRSVHDVLELV